MASTNDYFTPAPSDADNGQNAIYIAANANPNAQERSVIDGIPRQLLHVKMKINDCSQVPDLNFIDLDLMLLLSFYTNTPNGDYVSFDDINASDSENSNLCTMEVTGISTEEVNGGVGDNVSIFGINFGSISGTIEMRSADDGGASWVTLDQADYNWSNSQINIVVPSVIPLSINPLPILDTPGSGIIRVTNNAGTSSALSDHLIVDYSLLNTVVFPLKTRVVLAGVDPVVDDEGLNPLPGYNVIPAQNFLSNGDAVESLIAALRSWTCNTDIRWRLDENPDSQVFMDNDTLTSVKFGIIDPSNVLAQTEIWIVQCNLQSDLVYQYTFDITFSNSISFNWFYDETGFDDLPAGTHDFYAVALHELGHAHLLNHVNQITDIMYYADLSDANSPIPFFARKTLIEEGALVGGIEALNFSIGVSFAGCNDPSSSHTPLPVNFCNISTDVSASEFNGNFEFVPFPNPFEKTVNLRMQGAYSGILKYELFNSLGVSVDRRAKVVNQSSVQNFNFSDELAPGLYTLKIDLGASTYSFKLLKL